MQLIDKIRHKLFGHIWEEVSSRNEWWKRRYKFDPTSFRTLKCRLCGETKEQFFSEIFWKWL